MSTQFDPPEPPEPLAPSPTTALPTQHGNIIGFYSTTIDDVAAQLNPYECQLAVARALKVLGAGEWNSNTFDQLAQVLPRPENTGLPTHLDMDDDVAVMFWSTVEEQ